MSRSNLRESNLETLDLLGNPNSTFSAQTVDGGADDGDEIPPEVAAMLDQRVMSMIPPLKLLLEKAMTRAAIGNWRSLCGLPEQFEAIFQGLAEAGDGFDSPEFLARFAEPGIVKEAALAALRKRGILNASLSKR